MTQPFTSPERTMVENQHIIKKHQGPRRSLGFIEGLVRNSEISPATRHPHCFWGFQCLAQRGKLLGDFGTCQDQLEVVFLLFVHIFVFIIRRCLLCLGETIEMAFPFTSAQGMSCPWYFINLQRSHYSSQPSMYHNNKYAATLSSK